MRVRNLWIGALALMLPSGRHRHRPKSGGRLGQGPADVVSAEEDLGVAPADDGIELGRPLDATIRSADEIERTKNDVLGADGNGGSVGKNAPELPSGVASEHAVFRCRVVDQEHAALGEKSTQVGDLGIGER